MLIGGRKESIEVLLVVDAGVLMALVVRLRFEFAGVFSARATVVRFFVFLLLVLLPFFVTAVVAPVVIKGSVCCPGETFFDFFAVSVLVSGELVSSSTVLDVVPVVLVTSLVLVFAMIPDDDEVIIVLDTIKVPVNPVNDRIKLSDSFL